MALSIDLLGVRWEGGKYSLQEVRGYIGGPEKLMSDPRFRDVSQMQSYLDFMGVLTVPEALAMAKDCYAPTTASRTPEERAEWSGSSRYDTFAKSLRSASFVLVHVY